MGMLVLAGLAVLVPNASACVQFPPGNGCGWTCTYVDHACVPTPVPCVKVCTDSSPGVGDTKCVGRNYFENGWSICVTTNNGVACPVYETTWTIDGSQTTCVGA